MSQVHNLLDLFQQNHRDSKVPAADGKAAAKAAPAPGKSGRGGGDLLPPGADPKGNPGVSPSSFRARMEKSRSKLAAKERSAKAHDAAPGHTAPAKPNGSRSKPEAADSRSDGPRQAHAPRGAHAERADQNARAGRDGRAEARPNAGNGSDRSRQSGMAATTAPADAGGRPQTATPAPAEGETGLSRIDADAIKAGLDQLGIQVEDGQLDDPAFLMEILRLLQAMPAQALPGDEAQARMETEPLEGTDTVPDAETLSSQPDVTETMPDAPVQVQVQVQDQNQLQNQLQSQVQTQDQTEVPASSQARTDAVPAAPEAKTQGEAPKTLSRKELARLVEGRIAGLERAAQDNESAPAPGSAQAPKVTPREWQGVQARSHAEGPSTDPLPMADLDRLRVLQVAAAQSATVKDPSAGAQTDFALESDSVETSSPTASSASAESGHESTGAPGQDAQADLNGGNGEHTAGAGAAASKEGGQAAKGGEAGPQFHQVLDQARAAEHRPAIAAGAETRGETHGAAMLEQITRKLALAARKPGDEISIQLSPEHLGKVRVSLEMREDGMSARIAVENDSVRKQVEANLASLKDALKDQGIQLQGLEVSVDQRHSSLFNPDGSNAESFFRRQGRGEGGGRGGRNDESAPLEAAPESDTGRRWGYNTMEYIG